MKPPIKASDNLDLLEEKLGLKFKDKELLRQALVHRSYLNENKQQKESNERLEFLGDSVLSLVVSTKLYHDYTSYPEGKLTNLRSALVRTKTLSVLAEKLELGQFLLMSHGEETGGGRTNKSLLADALEAIIGAVYLDSGLEAVTKYLSFALFPLIANIYEDTSIIDYKSQLQEKTQQTKKASPHYKVLSESGPDHQKTFKVGVFVGNEQIGTGEGTSKQEAEQQAARSALEKDGSIS